MPTTRPAPLSARLPRNKAATLFVGHLGSCRSSLRNQFAKSAHQRRIVLVRAQQPDGSGSVYGIERTAHDGLVAQLAHRLRNNRDPESGGDQSRDGRVAVCELTDARLESCGTAQDENLMWQGPPHAVA